MSDPVHHPAHYTAYAEFEVIQLIEQMNFNRGNAVKYIARAGFKDDEIQDLQKARWYLDREIARLEGAASVAVSPEYKVGDPDTTPNVGPWCEDFGEGRCCTLADNHGGAWHVSGDGLTIRAVWPVS